MFQNVNLAELQKIRRASRHQSVRGACNGVMSMEPFITTLLCCATMILVILAMRKDSRAFDYHYVKLPLLPEQVKIAVLLNCPDLRLHALGVPQSGRRTHEPGDLHF